MKWLERRKKIFLRNVCKSERLPDCEWQSPKKTGVWWEERFEVWEGCFLEEKEVGREVDLSSSPSWPPSGAVSTRLAAFQKEGQKGFRHPGMESQGLPHSLGDQKFTSKVLVSCVYLYLCMHNICIF